MATRLPAAARRDQLLAAARTTFARQGFHAASMNDIAEAAGVTKPVLYQHFTNKRLLYLELLEDIGRRMLEDITEAAAAAASPAGQVEAGFRAYFRFVADDTPSFVVLFGSGARRDEEFAAAVRRVEGRIAETIEPLIAADIDHEHRRVLAHAIVGMAEVTSRWWVDRGLDPPADTLARQIAELAWAGLRNVRRVPSG